MCMWVTYIYSFSEDEYVHKYMCQSQLREMVVVVFLGLCSVFET